MLGHDPESFWDQTPRTISLAKEAFLDRFILDQHERVRIAWNTAMLIRTKNPPRIETLFMKTEKQRMDEEIEGLKNWVAATGGKVIYKQ